MRERPVTREQLDEIIACCRKRLTRADEKLCAAGAEHVAAAHALDAAEQRLVRWIEENPDPQGSLFQEGIIHV